MTFEFCFTPNLRKTEIRLDHLIAESIPHASWRKIKFELSRFSRTIQRIQIRITEMSWVKSLNKYWTFRFVRLDVHDQKVVATRNTNRLYPHWFLFPVFFPFPFLGIYCLLDALHDIDYSTEKSIRHRFSPLIFFYPLSFQPVTIYHWRVLLNFINQLHYGKLWHLRFKSSCLLQNGCSKFWRLSMPVFHLIETL
jgi:hypothetical protein